VTDPVGAYVVDGVDVDAVAVAVRGCPAVYDVAPAGLATVTTYLPGGRVSGIRVDDDRVVVQVRSRWPATASELARQVRDAVAQLVLARSVDVDILDVHTPLDQAPLIPEDNPVQERGVACVRTAAPAGLKSSGSATGFR